MMKNRICKNHQVYYALCVGEHEGEITATDPSGNTATQTVSFTNEAEGKKCSDSGGSGKASTDDEASWCCLQPMCKS